MIIFYLYDPLCGWCYGAAKALVALNQIQPITLTPTGLFADTGRKMTAEFAAYAWGNDQRIGAMTRQVYTQAYVDNVLGGTGDFDSKNILLALAAVRKIAPARELETLEALQTARYVKGRDNTDCAVISAVLAELDLAQAAAQLQDKSTAQTVAAQINQGQALMQALGLRGVPQIVAHKDGRYFVAENTLLYDGKGDKLVQWVKAL